MRTASVRLALAALSASLALNLMSAPADASPFAYSEIVSGDLPESLPASTIFQFDVGTNVVSGQKSFLTSPADSDSFAFSVPPKTQLVAISYKFTFDGFTTGNVDYSFNSSNAPGHGAGPHLEVFFSDSSPKSTFFPAIAFPLGPGTYALEDHHSVFGTTITYEWDITLRSVPGPATWLLLVTGLAGTMAFRRRAWTGRPRFAGSDNRQ